MRLWKFIVVGVAGLMTFPSVAQQVPVRPWEEYNRHIASKVTIQGLSDAFGDQVDFYNGSLSFRQVDIDIPGNSSLPVTFARTFNIVDRHYQILDGETSHPLPVGDWDLDMPRLSGIFAHAYQDYSFITNHSWPDQRCSGSRNPPNIFQFIYPEYWSGTHAHIPGGGEILEPRPGVQAPSTGGPYRWVTTGFTWLSCLPNIQNGTGEGFLAIAADGTKYWFDFMAKYPETMLEKPVYMYPSAVRLYRKRNVLYATRVEDKFGNWVTYSYSNVANAPARLDRILSNDGRQIDITYHALGHVSSVSDGTRNWLYRYGDNNDGSTYRLNSVVLPDASQWLFDLKGIQHVPAVINDESSCDHPGYVSVNHPPVSAEPTRTATITHPSGAVSEFGFGDRLHGRSDVPRKCLQIMPGANLYSDYVRMYWSLSLLRKRISGPGLPAMQWDYRYNDSLMSFDDHHSNYQPPGSWANNGTYSGDDPFCVSDSCASTVTTEITGPGGGWARYTFGNSYRYNEHKLLKIERGTGPSSISQVEQFTYELSRSGQAFPTPVGITLQYKGDAMAEAYLRPQRSRVIIQDGVTLKSLVNSFDTFGRPLSVTKNSSPVP